MQKAREAIKKAKEFLCALKNQKESIGLSDAALAKGEDYLQREQDELAIISFCESLEILDEIQKSFYLGEQLVDAAFVAGENCLQQGNRELAKKAFFVCSEIMSKMEEGFNLETRKKRADLLKFLERDEEAIEEYRLIAFVTKSIHDYGSALMAFFNILELSPKEATVFWEIAELCELMQKMDLAVKFYKKYARFHMNKGNMGEVSRVFNKIPPDNGGDDTPPDDNGPLASSVVLSV